EFRTRFGIPVSDEDVGTAPFYRPAEDSRELQYMRQRREKLGGFLPARSVRCPPLKAPPVEAFKTFFAGSGQDEFSTTMAFVALLKMLLRDKELGKWIVPIIPDEARTFGMDVLFNAIGIYSNVGQLYEPVDAK